MKYAPPFYVLRLGGDEPLVFPQPPADYFAIVLISDPTPGGGSRLYFYKPPAPPAAVTGKPTGFSCLFHTSLLSTKMREQLQALPMFFDGASPVYFLDPAREKRIRGLFEKMLAEMKEAYVFKYELLGNYLAEIIHQALKIQCDQCRQ